MEIAFTLAAALSFATAVWLAGTVAAAALMRVPMKTIAFGAGPVLMTLPLREGTAFELRTVPAVSNVTFVPRADVASGGRAFADLGRTAKVVLALSGCASCLLVAAVVLGPSAALDAAIKSWSDVFRVITHARDEEAQWAPMIEAARTLPTVAVVGMASAKVGGFNLLPLAGLSGWSAISALVAAPDGSGPPAMETVGKFTLFIVFGLLILWAISGVEFIGRATGMLR